MAVEVIQHEKEVAKREIICALQLSLWSLHVLAESVETALRVMKSTISIEQLFEDHWMLLVLHGFA